MAGLAGKGSITHTLPTARWTEFTAAIYASSAIFLGKSKFTSKKVYFR